MHITVDGSENGAELYHLSVLFQSLAKARGFAVPVSTTVSELSVKLDIDTTEATTALDKLAAHPHFADQTPVVNEAGHVIGTVTLNDPDTIEHVTGTDNGVSVGYVVTPVADIEANHADVTPTLDSAGLPWDARIHAGSRERNTDGSWRVRRKPKDTDQEEWNATLARVTAELRDLMEIPVTPGAVADVAVETAEPRYDTETHPINADHVTLTDAEIDTFVDIVQGVTTDPNDLMQITDVQLSELKASATVEPPVHVAPPVTIAPPIVIPPVTAVAPPIVTASPAIETFAQVMTFLTARTPKDEAEKPAMVAKVNEILAANGLTVLTQLGQRPDLIPQIMMQFNEAFGE